MNSFFTRFETHYFSSHISDVKQSLMPDDSAVIDQERVLGLFKHIGVNKCPGPDGICGRTLRFCAEQLSGVFQRLFQTSIDTCTIPIFHLLVSQLGSEEQEQSAKNCPYRLKITAVPQRDLALFCEQQILRRARSILAKKDHILNQEFTALPSGRCLRCPICRMNRFKNSCMPVAVRLLNNT